MEQIALGAISGIFTAIQPEAILFVIIGTALGMLAGALPGITPLTGMAVLLPFTIGMQPEYGVILLTSVLVGSQYGNSIPAVLIRTPGTASAVLITDEGYPFHLRGESGRALGHCLISSAVGTLLSMIVFIFLVVPLSWAAVYFLFPEIFALAILGMTAAAGLAGKNPVKGLLAAAFGVALSTIGPDAISSVPRFSFGVLEMEVGIDIIPLLIGFLAISQALQAARQDIQWDKVVGKFSAAMPPLSEVLSTTRPTIIGTIIGIFIGALPGAGSSIAAFIAYQQAKQTSKHPERFGKGSIEALTSVNAANNAAIGGELIPTLGLGIPGAPVMALIMGALIIQGIQPGPTLMRDNPQIVYAAFGGLFTATIAMVVIGYLTIRPSVFISTISRPAVTITTIVLTIVGVYTVNWSLFDVWVAFIMGIIGYFMMRYGFALAPAALGMVLGTLMEDNLRRGLVMTGSYGAFFSRPITIIILVAAAFGLLYPYWATWLAKIRKGSSEEDNMWEGGD